MCRPEGPALDALFGQPPLVGRSLGSKTDEQVIFGWAGVLLHLYTRHAQSLQMVVDDCG